MRPRLLIAAQVDAVIPHSARVRGLRLRPRHREAFPGFVPGDHVQLQHETGVRRDYSLISAPDDTSRYEIAVQREPDGRGGSVLFHDGLSPGDTVFVSYPQPGFRIDPTASDHLFVAGGIGVTAILGLLPALPGGSRGVLHYAVRRPEDAILTESLARYGVDVSIHSSSMGTRLDLELVVARAPADAIIYACGPPGLLDSLEEVTVGRPNGTVRVERFAAAPPPDELLGDAFAANLLGAKRTIEVGERESLLRALRRSGIPLDYSCESGVCGSCVLEVTRGDVDHRDLCLTDDDRRTGFMAACVSRGRGAIDLLI